MSDSIRAIAAGAAGALAPIETPRLANPSPLGHAGTRALAGEGIGHAGGPGFTDVLKDALTEARGNERTAEDMAQRFAAGDPGVGIHEAMIASEKASISLRFAVTLKNRVLEAYRELMNTSV